MVIATAIEDCKTDKITYAEVEFDVRAKIYQSVNPHFNPDVEYMKDLLQISNFKVLICNPCVKLIFSKINTPIHYNICYILI